MTLPDDDRRVCHGYWFTREPRMSKPFTLHKQCRDCLLRTRERQDNVVYHRIEVPSFTSHCSLRVPPCS